MVPRRLVSWRAYNASVCLRASDSAITGLPLLEALAAVTHIWARPGGKLASPSAIVSHRP